MLKLEQFCWMEVELMSQEYGHIHSGLQQLANSFPLRFDPRISANTFAPRQICELL